MVITMYILIYSVPSTLSLTSLLGSGQVRCMSDDTVKRYATVVQEKFIVWQMGGFMGDDTVPSGA